VTSLPDNEWDGVCACGKADMDGKRCALGATHRERDTPPAPEWKPLHTWDSPGIASYLE